MRMRRADRLFQIVQHLRGGRLVTARMLGERLEVSERTIYRDIADLQSTGVPIDGEAGVGYIMREGFDLPPLMFTRDEIVALVAGARHGPRLRRRRRWRGRPRRRWSRSARCCRMRNGRASTAPRSTCRSGSSPTPTARPWTRWNAPSSARDVLRFAYSDEAGRATARDVRPLGLWFWGKVWTLVAWCELREDFRAFRIDRISALEPAGRTFRLERGKQLADFYRQMEMRESRAADGRTATRACCPKAGPARDNDIREQR